MSPCVSALSWKSVADYIDQQFEQYFRDESGLNRKNIQDNRVHCCLYFISPFGHGYDEAADLSQGLVGSLLSLLIMRNINPFLPQYVMHISQRLACSYTLFFFSCTHI